MSYFKASNASRLPRRKISFCSWCFPYRVTRVLMVDLILVVLLLLTINSCTNIRTLIFPYDPDYYAWDFFGQTEDILITEVSDKPEVYKIFSSKYDSLTYYYTGTNTTPQRLIVPKEVLMYLKKKRVLKQIDYKETIIEDINGIQSNNYYIIKPKKYIEKVGSYNETMGWYEIDRKYARFKILGYKTLNKEFLIIYDNLLPNDSDYEVIYMHDEFKLK